MGFRHIHPRRLESLAITDPEPRVTLCPYTDGIEVNNKLYSIIHAPYGSYVHVPNIYNSNPSLHNIDPRIGLAWDLFKNHRTSLRAGFGLFHNIIGPRDFGAEYYNNPPFKTGTQFNPTFPVIFSAVSPT